MNANTRKSLLDLAAEAEAAAETGSFQAGYAIQGEQLGEKGLASIRKAAMAGHEDSQEALQALDEAREATFTDPFARQAYFLERLMGLAAAEKPDPEMVLATLFSAQATRMYVRGEGGREQKPAIPLFHSYNDRGDAIKALGGKAFPIRVSSSERTEQGNKREHISGDSFKFLVPATAADTDCYEKVRKLLGRMSLVMADDFEGRDNYDVRQAVWLALNLIPGARVFHPGAVKRIFDDNGDGTVTHKSNNTSFVRYDLSSHEVLVLDYTAPNQRIVGRLKIFAESIKRVVKK